MHLFLVLLVTAALHLQTGAVAFRVEPPATIQVIPRLPGRAPYRLTVPLGPEPIAGQTGTVTALAAAEPWLLAAMNVQVPGRRPVHHLYAFDLRQQPEPLAQHIGYGRGQLTLAVGAGGKAVWQWREPQGRFSLGETVVYDLVTQQHRVLPGVPWAKELQVEGEILVVGPGGRRYPLRFPAEGVEAVVAQADLDGDMRPEKVIAVPEVWHYSQARLRLGDGRTVPIPSHHGRITKVWPAPGPLLLVTSDVGASMGEKIRAYRLTGGRLEPVLWDGGEFEHGDLYLDPATGAVIVSHHPSGGGDTLAYLYREGRLHQADRWTSLP